VLTTLIARSGLEPDIIDDVIWGCVTQIGDQSTNVGRLAVLAAGWPESIPGTTVDRACGSSQQAVHFAAGAVMSGQCDVVIAGGVESMSRVPIGSAPAERDALRSLGPGALSDAELQPGTWRRDDGG
jgi:acetyl-CoA acyltransferase